MCLFRTDERVQEGRLVSALGQCASDPAKVLTGSKNGTLKVAGQTLSIFKIEIKTLLSIEFWNVSDFTDATN